MIALILGCGPHGRVILDVLRAQGCFETIEFIDEKQSLWGKEVNGCTVTGGFDSLAARDSSSIVMIVAIGNSPLRMRLAARAREQGIELLNAQHPSAVVMPTAHMGSGNMIAAHAVVNSNAGIGDNIIINSGAIVEHDAVVMDGVSISPGVQLGGRTRVEQLAFLGTGAIVLPRIRVGAGSVVAAGSVVTRDVPPGVLVRGTPARAVEDISRDFDWNRIL